ncbi:MAG: hypothetical protein L6Q83_08080 [Gammaproteobacteria bacterium]|nr:hypothetical protein [Gammaproteobacteria bacterium]
MGHRLDLRARLHIVWSDFPQGYQWMMIFSDGASWILMAGVMAWCTTERKPSAG